MMRHCLQQNGYEFITRVAISVLLKEALFRPNLLIDSGCIAWKV